MHFHAITGHGPANHKLALIPFVTKQMTVMRHYNIRTKPYVQKNKIINIDINWYEM